MSENKEEIPKMDKEDFRLFYQIQYDRIDKLETKRENFCNFVLTLSAAIIVFSLSADNNKSIQYTNILIIFIVLINLAAIIFVRKTRPFIKMHQKRADLASEKYAKEFNEIKKKVEKVDSDKDFFNRSNIYTYLHGILILIMFLLLGMENKLFCQ